MTMTYDYLKELYYDDAFKILEKGTLEKLGKALDDWYRYSDLDMVNRITGINPMDAPEDVDLEDGDDSETRDDLIDKARVEWNKNTVERKFGKFADLSDDAIELNEFLKPYNTVTFS
jgi:hypothetical protein